MDQRPVMDRQLMILVVKFLYLAVNVGTFMAFDSVMNGLFGSFGGKWLTWMQLENTERFDYMGDSNYPKPGNQLNTGQNYSKPVDRTFFNYLMNQLIRTNRLPTQWTQPTQKAGN